MALAAGAVNAQTAPASPAGSSPPAPLVSQGGSSPQPTPLVSQSVARTLEYRSIFEGYRPYADQPVQSWRESNDTVGRIGGWRTYLREAQPPADAKGPAGSDRVDAPPRDKR